MRHMTFFASYAVHMESVNIRQENCSHGKQDYISSIDIEGPCKPCLITIFIIHENLDLLAAIGRPDRARNYSFCLSLCKIGHYILDQSFHCKLWHSWLWSFQGRDTKLERFLAKNQLYSNEITKFWELEYSGLQNKRTSLNIRSLWNIWQKQ